MNVSRNYENVKTKNVEIMRRDYFAQGAWETFLSAEQPVSKGIHPPILIGLLRLR